MIRVVLWGVLLIGCPLFSSVVHAAGGIDDIARPGKPVNIDLTVYPEGTQALANHAIRADGWRPWFTEWPNDVTHFSFDARSTADVQAILDAFSAIKVHGKQVRLSVLPEPANLGWVSRIPEGRKIAVLFTTGDQATVDAWYKRVRKPFGQIEFTAAPVAVPPTLTIFVGNPAVKLRELKIPQEVEVIHGNVPGTFHVWNDKESAKAAAQIPGSPADVKQVTEINTYIEQRAEASVPAGRRGDAAKLQGVWIEEYTEHGGEKIAQDQRFIFVGDRFFRLDGDRVIEEGIFTIDSSGPIKKIDYRCLKGYRNNRGTDEVLTRLAIYELDGDSLREFGPWGTDHWSNRPTTFTATTDLTNYRTVMKRESR